MKLYFNAMSNLSDFNGRSSLREFLDFMLVILSLFLIAYIVSFFNKGWAFGIVFLNLFLHIIPLLSLAFRRIHDTNRSNCSLIIFMVPFIGNIVVLWWLCQKGSIGENDYGPPPVYD
jgi:uncharacterized membrane protein YhaH (DUF805 family)